MFFSEGKFPTRYKTTSVTPLLKKKDLDSDVASNYRPISNRHTISKMLERLFIARIRAHVESCRNLNHYQSAYRRGHSTETRLLGMLDNVNHPASRQSLSVSIAAASPVCTQHLTPSTNRLSSAGWIIPSVYMVYRSGLTPTSTIAVSTSELAIAFRHLSAATTECLEAVCSVPCFSPFTLRQLLTSSHASEMPTMHGTPMTHRTQQ